MSNRVPLNAVFQGKLTRDRVSGWQVGWGAMICWAQTDCPVSLWCSWSEKGKHHLFCVLLFIYTQLGYQCLVCSEKHFHENNSSHGICAHLWKEHYMCCSEELPGGQHSTSHICRERPGKNADSHQLFCFKCCACLVERTWVIFGIFYSSSHVNTIKSETHKLEKDPGGCIV